MKQLIKNKHWEINKDYNLDKTLYLLIDRYDENDIEYSYVWKNKKNEYHRDYDLPAIIEYSGQIDWFKNDKYFRNNNKPVIIFSSGYKEYRK